jgi:hypothetical protein
LASLAPAVSKSLKPSVFAQGLRRTRALNKNLPFVDGHYLSSVFAKSYAGQVQLTAAKQTGSFCYPNLKRLPGFEIF